MSQRAKTRIPPVLPENFSPEQQAVAEGLENFNFARVMVHHPDLYRVYIPFAEKLMAGSILSPREREIVILRTLALCGETYDAPHHRHIARQIGMTEGEIDAAAAGQNKHLSPCEQVLVAAAEELVSRHLVSEDTWSLLQQHFSRRQLMEIVFLVGNYTTMAMATNTFGIPLEEGFR